MASTRGDSDLERVAVLTKGGARGLGILSEGGINTNP